MEPDLLIKGFKRPSVGEGKKEVKGLVAQTFFSGFMHAHDTYNAISMASNGKIYYVLSCDKHDIAGKMYSYDPGNNHIELIADLTEICGEKNKNYISQGKSHVEFFESGNKLYFSTHVGYYQLIDGMERMPMAAPEGYSLYNGGHILSYDLITGAFENLAIVPGGEGAVAMTMDCNKKQIFIISWPTGKLIHYDVEKKSIRNLGKICLNGEAGTPGIDFRLLCRSLVVNHLTGIVYFSSSEGDIFSYKPGDDAFKKLEGVDLRIDYFGKYDFTRPGNMGYNWRKIFWHDEQNVAYGVHGNSGYLFRFDTENKKIELIDRITSWPSKKCGMYDQFSYGYLGFALGPDKKTIYYLTGGPIYLDGRRLKGEDEIARGASKGEENLHLVTYNIETNFYTDHGPVFYENGERPSYVNSIAIDLEGNVYTLARMTIQGKVITDLIKIPNPFQLKQNGVLSL